MKFFKKSISLFMAGVLTISPLFPNVVMGTVSAEESGLPTPIYENDFENGLKAETETIIKQAGLNSFPEIANPAPVPNFPTSRSGLGKALQLQGENSANQFGLMVDVPTPEEGHQQYTISFWMNAQSYNGAYGTIAGVFDLAAASAGTEKWWSFHRNSNSLAMWSRNAAGTMTSHFTGPNLSNAGNNSRNVWQHITITVDHTAAGSDGGNCSLYRNGGTLAGGTNGSTASNNIRNNIFSKDAKIIFGTNPWDEYFDGMIDNVRVYDTVLTPEEVRDVYKEDIRVPVDSLSLSGTPMSRILIADSTSGFNEGAIAAMAYGDPARFGEDALATEQDVIWEIISGSELATLVTNPDGTATITANPAAISGTVTVQAASAENSTITQTIDYRIITDSALIPVTELEIIREGITLETAATADLKQGTTFQLTQRVIPENATIQEVEWSSSNPAVATIAQDGTVTLIGTGETTITAASMESSAKKTEVTLSVIRSATRVALNKYAVPVLKSRGTYQLLAAIQPANSTDTSIEWSSSDDSIASVNSEGLVTFNGTGVVNITAKAMPAGTTTSICKFTVRDEDPLSEFLLDRYDFNDFTRVPETGNITSVSDGTRDLPVVRASGGTRPELSVDNEFGQVLNLTANTYANRNYLSLPNPFANLPVDDGFTVNFWTKSKTDPETARALIDFELAPATTGRAGTLAINQSRIYYNITDQNGAYTDFNADQLNLRQDAWRMVTVCITKTGMDVYSNGQKINVPIIGGTPLYEAMINELAGTGEIATPEQTNVKLGASAATYWTCAGAFISEVSFYKKALNPAEIGSIYEDTKVHKATSMTIEPEILEFNGLEAEKTITITKDSDDMPAWTSSNPEIAIVEAINATQAQVKPLKPGTTTLTATLDGVQATCQVTVNPVALEQITLNRQETTIPIGATTRLTAVPMPGNATDKDLSWSSSDDLVATVSTTGSVTGIKEGTAVITAMAADGSSISASMNVTVVQPKDYNYSGALEKSTLGNPILGFGFKNDEEKQSYASESPYNPIYKIDYLNGESFTYGGDPTALVDSDEHGDIVYLYVGHDDSTGSAYQMPRYMCYSSRDMVSWKYEGEIMRDSDVSWGDSSLSCWASQVVKYKGMYYIYHCTWASSAVDGGRQSIGVAVADTPTGWSSEEAKESYCTEKGIPYGGTGAGAVNASSLRFVDIGQPLVKGSQTAPQTSNWNDIDPTVWTETDENGEDQRWLAWGNGIFYLCELNEDMISVTDKNDDGIINNTAVDGVSDITQPTGVSSFTEAPWIYRRQDEDGNYYGPYYNFYAYGWREQMAYATTDDLSKNTWTFGNILMPPTVGADTNHPAVIDFKGKSYFIYHNGALPGGFGQRRSICVEEFEFNEDGSIDPIMDTTSGISGWSTRIVDFEGVALSHERFTNPSGDSSYPLTRSIGFDENARIEDARWELRPGKFDKEEASYVSVEAFNKPGLYLSASNANSLVITQDNALTTAAASKEAAQRMTFRVIPGLSGEGISFESLMYPGHFVTSVDSKVTLTDGSDEVASTFYIPSLSSIEATAKKEFTTGDVLTEADFEVMAHYVDGKVSNVTGFTLHAEDIDMETTGDKTVTISYSEEYPEDPDDTDAVRNFKKKFAQTKTVDITFTVTKESGPELYGHSLTLDGTIGVNWYVSLPQNLQNTDTKMKFTYRGQEMYVPFDETASQITGEDDTVYRFTYFVAAKEMTEEISAQLLGADNTPLLEEDNYTVKIYADKMLKDNDYGSEAKAFAKAMLNYGGYAQSYFKYNIENLANQGIEELPEIEMPTVSTHASYGSDKGTDESKWYGSSLILESKVTVRHYVRITNAEVAKKAYMKYGNGDEEIKLMKHPTLADIYYADIVNIAAPDLNKKYEARIYKKEGSLEVAISNSKGYGAYSYAFNIITRSQDVGLKNLAKAMCGYGEAAKVYLDFLYGTE